MKRIQGRPALPIKRQKRLHYSVWVNEDQKRAIDERVAQSNLSASQYILAQLELIPVRLPARRDIPDHISRQIINLEKLSGLLAFYAHRAKDKELISEEWIKSSQLIRRLSELVSKWLFEQFEIPQTLLFFDANDKSFDNLLQLISSGEECEEKRIYLSEILKIQKRHELISSKYKRFYTSLDHDLSIFDKDKIISVDDIHTEIQKQVNLIMELI